MPSIIIMFKEFYDKTIVEMSPSEGNALSATLWYLTTNMSYDFGQTLFNPEPLYAFTSTSFLLTPNP